MMTSLNYLPNDAKPHLKAKDPALLFDDNSWNKGAKVPLTARAPSSSPQSKLSAVVGSLHVALKRT